MIEISVSLLNFAYKTEFRCHHQITWVVRYFFFISSLRGPTTFRINIILSRWRLYCRFLNHIEFINNNNRNVCVIFVSAVNFCGWLCVPLRRQRFCVRYKMLVGFFLFAFSRFSSHVIFWHMIHLSVECWITMHTTFQLISRTRFQLLAKLSVSGLSVWAQKRKVLH